MSLAVAEEHNN